MNFWETITGSDITKEMKSFESRAKKLPADYQAVWDEINSNNWVYSDFTGRNRSEERRVGKECIYRW